MLAVTDRCLLATLHQPNYTDCGTGPIMSKRTPPKVRKLTLTKQQRLDALLEKNAEGTISDKEKRALQLLVAEAEKLMVANSQRLADFARSQSAPPVTAVPVTVWVNPELAGS